MEVKIISTDGTEKGNIKLPKQFNEKIRSDVVKKAVDAIEANNRQRYGAKPDAGMRASAKLSRRRNDFRGSYGHGISRVPRKIMSARGTRFNWVAAVVPGVVGGRKAHPPKSTKIFNQKINPKEKRLAIRSALAAAFNKEAVAERGHKAPEKYPFIIDDAIESIKKTKDLVAVLVKLGFQNELKRTEERKIRAGKGKLRGRRHITKKGLLIVTSKKSDVEKSCSNITGFETARVDNINTKQLAPGGVAGRLVLFSKSAIDRLEKEALYTENRVKKEEPKKEEPKQDKALKKDQK